MKTKLTLKSFSELFVGSLKAPGTGADVPKEPLATNLREHLPATILPPEPSRPSANPAAPIRALPVPRRRILLADDDAGIRDSLGKLLRKSGYHVFLAAHGGHVLDRVLNEEFDLLLLDLNMPQLDGCQTLYHLSTLKPQLPVVVITAQPDQQNWMRDAGACVLMEKPLDLPLFLETVRILLDEQQCSAPKLRLRDAGAFRYVPRRPSKVEFGNRFRHWGINE